MGRRPLCLAAVLLVLWIAGMHLAGQYPMIRPPDACIGKKIRVQGQIYRQEKKDTTQIYLKNNSILSGNEKQSLNGNLIIFTREETDYQIGNIIEATGYGQQLQTAGNPGQFDMAGWYQAQKIGMTMTKCQTRLRKDSEEILQQRLAELRGRLEEVYDDIADEKEASLLRAMLLGDKGGLDEEVKTLYQDSGISHVLAISGLHISLLGMMLLAILRWIGLPFAGAGALCGGMLGLYCVMTGMSVSAVRAFVMFLVSLGATALGRTYDIKNSLALAVILLLFDNPLLLFQGGFQLSALAVLGLAYLYPVLKKTVRREGKVMDSFLVSVSVQLAVFPCMLYHFYQFSAFGIFLNLLVLPCMSILLLDGALAGIVGLVSVKAGIFLFSPGHYLLRLILGLCRCVQGIPAAVQIWGRPEWESIAVYYVVLLSVYCCLKYRKAEKRERILCSVFLAFAVMGLSRHPRADLEMTFLDVGQGDSIFWRMEDGTTCLCDGGSSSVSEVGKYRIVPFLKYKGITKLDYLFLTHMDEDHVNGAAEILEKDMGIEVECLVLPDIQKKDERYLEICKMAQKRKIPVVAAHAGMGWKARDWEIECLAPQKGADGEEKNADSEVLALQCGNFRALLTGDLEGEGEEALIKSGKIGKLSVLKAAHHGSKYSTSEIFLAQATPKAAVISCGKDNSYGHPAPELLRRLYRVGADCYETRKQGAVTVVVEEGEFRIIPLQSEYPSPRGVGQTDAFFRNGYEKDH